MDIDGNMDSNRVEPSLDGYTLEQEFSPEDISTS